VFVLMKIKRLSMYSTLRFDLKSALGGAPLDAAREKKNSAHKPLYLALIKELRALITVTHSSDHAL
jgi:hypothetical protein